MGCGGRHKDRISKWVRGWLDLNEKTHRKYSNGGVVSYIQMHTYIQTYIHIPYINVYSNSMVSSVKGYLFWNMHCVIVSPCKWRVMTSNTEFRLGSHIIKALGSMQEIWHANAARKANVRTTIRRHDDTMRRTYTVFTKTHKEMTHAFSMH